MASCKECSAVVIRKAGQRGPLTFYHGEAGTDGPYCGSCFVDYEPFHCRRCSQPLPKLVDTFHLQKLYQARPSFQTVDADVHGHCKACAATVMLKAIPDDVLVEVLEKLGFTRAKE